MAAAGHRNWAGNITFTPAELHRPSSVVELQRLVAASPRIHALGTGHSFSPVADGPGELVSVAGLPQRADIDRKAMTVSVSAGMRYAELAAQLDDAGLALRNLGSLPHISVAGACSTGTHGSGDGVGCLATAVRELELVAASGDLLRLDRSDEGFSGAVIALGALGVITRLTLDVVPAFELSQRVYENLPFDAALGELSEVFASGYSVSLFTTWTSDVIDQVWVKSHTADVAPLLTALGATPANGPLHMIRGLPSDNCTDQSGALGPWFERLPHFRAGHRPSAGDELQSEYLVDRASGSAAIDALRAVSSAVARPLQVCEIRTIAADELWLSPAFRRDSLGLHFTWLPDAGRVKPAIEAVESALAPFTARPHWGKVFRMAPADVAPRYPRLRDFQALASRLDPERCFSNPMIDTYLLDV